METWPLWHATIDNCHSDKKARPKCKEIHLYVFLKNETISYCIKMLFVIKPDIFCIPCKLRICKFSKNSMDVNYMHPEIKDQGMKVLWDYHNFRGLLVLDPEPKEMYHCHPYHFMEICKPPVNEPIGSYQIHHLKLNASFNEFKINLKQVFTLIDVDSLVF